MSFSCRLLTLLLHSLLCVAVGANVILSPRAIRGGNDLPSSQTVVDGELNSQRRLGRIDVAVGALQLVGPAIDLIQKCKPSFRTCE